MTREKQTAIQQFLSWGKSRVEARDRGAMADLRRGFSSGTESRCWPYIARYCDLANDRERKIWQTVAAGFATHEGTSRYGNIGNTMRALALDGATGKVEDALRSFDARFRRLLTCSTPVEVCERLPGIIRAAKNKGVAVDYETLFNDLKFWGSGERVKVRWASAYWGEKSNQDLGGGEE